MASNDLKSKLNEMMNIIGKHWVKNNIPVSQLSEKEQLHSLVIICKELGIEQDIVSNLIIYENMNENLLKVQEYYIENEIYKEYSNKKFKKALS